MIELASAQREVQAACPPPSAVELPIEQALGCVLAVDVTALAPVPPFDNSSVDGYALRAGDITGATAEQPMPLSVLGSVPAGSVAARPIGAGQTWKVMTGAPLPDGADAVVMIEQTSAHSGVHPGPSSGEPGDTVAIMSSVELGANIRRAGSDVAAGELVLPAGTVLAPAHLGVLASVGMRTPKVYPRLQVGLLVTGDELVTDDRPLKPGQIYESNGVMLAALLRQANCIPVQLGVAGDDPSLLAARLVEAAAGCDAIITTGGVSMGDADPVKAALAELGRLHWMQVSIRPAKPFAYAVLDGDGLNGNALSGDGLNGNALNGEGLDGDGLDGAVVDGGRRVPIFGLPGNPVSSLVSFELLARPALLAMMGHRSIYRPRVLAIADEPMRALGRDGRTSFLRVITSFGPDGRLHARPVTGQDSHQLAQSAQADGLAELAPATTVEAGGEVTVHSLVWD